MTRKLYPHQQETMGFIERAFQAKSRLNRPVRTEHRIGDRVHKIDFSLGSYAGVDCNQCFGYAPWLYAQETYLEYSQNGSTRLYVFGVR